MVAFCFLAGLLLGGCVSTVVLCCLQIRNINNRETISNCAKSGYTYLADNASEDEEC